MLKISVPESYVGGKAYVHHSRNSQSLGGRQIQTEITLMQADLDKCSNGGIKKKNLLRGTGEQRLIPARLSVGKDGPNPILVLGSRFILLRVSLQVQNNPE